MKQIFSKIIIIIASFFLVMVGLSWEKPTDLLLIPLALLAAFLLLWATEGSSRSASKSLLIIIVVPIVFVIAMKLLGAITAGF